MSTCISNKRVFLTELLAEDALIDAWSTNTYSSNRGPVSVYRCDDCGCYHFTSQGKMNERLEKEIASGKIKIQREAKHWESRMKK